MFILTIVDGMFVGNGVGTDELGAVSLAMPFVMLVGAFSGICYAASLFASLMYGLAGGLQPLYGLSYGAKDDKSLRWQRGFAL